MSFDIDAMEASKDATFNVDVGKDEKTGEKVGFVVVGQGNARHTDVLRQINLWNIQDHAKRKETLDAKSEEGAAQVVAATDHHRRMMINACVVGWYGFMRAGAPAEFSEENLWKILALRPRWADRILGAIDDDENFVTG